MDEHDKVDSFDDSEKIEILSTDDKKIKSIGELLSNDTSRQIWKLLLENEMTANQIAEKTGMLLSLVIYHLKNMLETEIIKVSKIGKNVKERDMLYYTTSRFAVIILPSNISEKAKQSKSLLHSLKKLYKFAAIGISTVSAYLVSQNIQIGQIQSGMRIPVTESVIHEYNLWPIVIALLVAIGGLIIERILKAYKR